MIQKVRNPSERIRLFIQTTSTKLAGNVPDLPLTFPVHLGSDPVSWLVIIQRDRATYHVSVVPVFWVIVITCPFANETSPGYNATP